MIKDILKNCETYYSISENLKKGFEWLLSTDLEAIKPDKYCIDGENIFANVQEYETKEDANFETHKKYIDIQYMIKGKEVVGVTNRENCITCEQYNTDTDLEFLTCSSKNIYYPLKEGEFFVFFPQDAHKPSIKYKEKNIVKKVIVKVAIN